MKALRVLLAGLVFALFTLAPAEAKSKGSSSGSSSGTVHVKGYTRKDGTYVPPHTRTKANGTKNDNWSTKGNVNPHTGKVGTKQGDGQTGYATSTQPSASNSNAAGTASARVTEGWSKLRSGMTKTEVLALLGEPNLKTATKWVYTDRGTVNFDATELAK